MANNTPAKIAIIIGLLLFITGVVMGRYFPSSHPDLGFVVRSGSTGVLVVGLINFWQVKRAAKKGAPKA